MARKKSKFRFNIASIALLFIAVPIIIFLVGGFVFFIEKESQTNQQFLDQIIDEDLFPFGTPIAPFECTQIELCPEITIQETDVTPVDVIMGDVNEIVIEEPFEEIQPELEEPVITVDIDATIIEEEIAQQIVPTSVEIVSNVIKTDNEGNRFESKTNFEIPLLAIFVEDTSNLDFDNGLIEQELFIQTDPNVSISGTAKFQLLIGEQRIFQTPIQVSVDGITDEQGNLQINFISPTGVPSRTFTFQFNDFLDDFPISTDPQIIEITKVSFTLEDILLDVNGFEFGLNSTESFSMDIARDPNRIIITNESGERIKVFPTDDNLKVGSYNGSRKYKSCSRSRCTTYSIVLPAKQMGGGNVFNILASGETDLIASFQSSTGHVTKLNTFIQRDEVFRIDFISPAGTVTFKTPEIQKNYVFYCRTVLSGGNSGDTLYCNYRDPNVKQALADTLTSGG